MKCRPRKISKLATRIIAFLLLGAILNIAVAWVLAFSVCPALIPKQVSLWHDAQGLDGFAGWNVYQLKAFGTARFSAMLRDTFALSGSVDVGLESAYPAWSDWPAALDAKVELARQRPPAKAGGRMRGAAPMPTMVEARGWPFLALRCEWDGGVNTDNTLTTRHWRGAIALPPRVPDRPFTVSLDEQRALPLRPIWPGFAINTIFYAAILWLPFAAFGRIRRRRRIKRGLCPACAYPMGTSAVCTECGYAVKA